MAKIKKLKKGSKLMKHPLGDIEDIGESEGNGEKTCKERNISYISMCPSLKGFPGYP
jgi:hypothetical protein